MRRFRLTQPPPGRRVTPHNQEHSRRGRPPRLYSREGAGSGHPPEPTRHDRSRDTQGHRARTPGGAAFAEHIRRAAPPGRPVGLRHRRRARRRVHHLGCRFGGHAQRRLGRRTRRRDERGRVGVRAGRERVRGVRAVGGVQPLRQDPARHRRGGPGVPHGLLDRDDVQCRHGHRPDVLRRCRAARAFHQPAAGHGSSGVSGGARRRDGHHAVPLDAASVGDLRGGGTRDRLQHVPPRAPAADQLSVRAAAGRAPHGGRVRQGRRHPGHFRHAVRLGRVARARHAPDRGGPAGQRGACACRRSSWSGSSPC